MYMNDFMYTQEEVNGLIKEFIGTLENINAITAYDVRRKKELIESWKGRIVNAKAET